MSNIDISFIYQDASGNITARNLSEISETDEYLQGICLSSAELRTFRKDRILEKITDQNTLEDRLQFHVSVNPPPKAPPKSHHLLDICFTGFKSDDKKRLIEYSQNASFIVRSSVTRSLNFLCCGYNAGPSKIKKARKQGVVALTEEQFLQLLETGDIPEN